MSPAAERRLLQAAIAIAGIVPVDGGLWGVFGHMSTTGALSTSNARYLSGLLLGIGLTFWIAIPTIERRGTIVRGLAAIVVIGGLARLAGALLVTGFPPAVALPLVMELGVTPAIAVWRERVERRLTA
ncbi:DUF4345 family protein [Phenylobacterium sp.]|uniref:DUF4345 family protein n=1 Tax=Phenylobacterium sp. TaxID=1871053 RepID=UPI001216E36C|nr:DUF4345 family protein [Phenylobacterium sp.]THD62365.1 MAG: DUF4345 domain-containing protein [Phenylobacterium sp.]